MADIGRGFSGDQAFAGGRMAVGHGGAGRDADQNMFGQGNGSHDSAESLCVGIIGAADDDNLWTGLKQLDTIEVSRQLDCSM